MRFAIKKTFESPSVLNKRGKPIGSAQRTMIVNTYKAYDGAMSPLKQNRMEIYSAIGETLGIGVRTVRSVITEYEVEGTVTSPKHTKDRSRTTIFALLDEFSKHAIRMVVHDFYHRKEIPTVDLVLARVNDDVNLPSFKRSSFHKVLKALHFVYEKRDRKSMLIDREDICRWRRSYLRTVKQFRREGRKVYYLDETWVTAGHTTGKVWVDKTVKSHRDAFLRGLSTGIGNPTGKGSRLIIVHIGSDSGFVDGGLYVFEAQKSADYHAEMTGVVFQDWFKGVLELLEPNSVIVLDNAPYHTVQAEKIPTSSWRKQHIIDWLDSKGIAQDGTMIKDKLLHLVRIHKDEFQSYVIDNMAEAGGHTVLRTPPYHCELNPIELVWAQVKGYVARHNTTFKLADVKNLLIEGISRVTPADWKRCVEHVKKVEVEFWALDGLVDEAREPVDIEVEPMIINLGEDSSSDEGF